jgi:hypothetical protein
MLERTETEWGPWTIVESTDRRHTHIKVYETIIRALEERLQITPQEETTKMPADAAVDAGATPPEATLPEEVVSKEQQPDSIKPENGAADKSTVTDQPVAGEQKQSEQ